MMEGAQLLNARERAALRREVLKTQTAAISEVKASIADFRTEVQGVAEGYRAKLSEITVATENANAKTVAQNVATTAAITAAAAANAAAVAAAAAIVADVSVPVPAPSIDPKQFEALLGSVETLEKSLMKSSEALSSAAAENTKKESSLENEIKKNLGSLENLKQKIGNLEKIIEEEIEYEKAEKVAPVTLE